MVALGRTSGEKLNQIKNANSGLEKAFGRLPKEELWLCIGESVVAEKYVRLVQDMNKSSMTLLR